MYNEQKNIDFIIVWLGGLSPWHRPEQAISWDGFKNIFSDIELFLLDVRSYVSQISMWSFFERVKEILFSPWQLLFMIIKIGIFLLAAAVIRLYMPYISNRLLLVTGSWRWVSLIAACMGGFFSRYFVLFFIWFFVRTLLAIGFATDIYVYVLFYLASIPYFLYITYRFIAYFISFNARQGYGILSKSFQRRFIMMLHAVLYPTVAIYFFRQAFILSSYYKSEIPAILLAINFIIFQIAVIFLISKDQVLNLIPHKPDFWEMIHSFVNRYFYAILVFIIAVVVMSNPYIGFGRLVWHVLKGLLFTYILLRSLFALHSYVRKFSSRFFFSTDENEVAHDRFAYAKTWYGIFIIVSLLIFMALGLIIGMRIWGWSFGIDDIIEWLQTPIFTIASNHITTVSLLRVVAFVLGGFVVSHIINRYVLNRVFELLLVDVGIQNTLTSILEYFIIISAVFLGFNNAGLGSLVGYLLGALILSIGWVIKEPVSDFIAYFILLVQRPIKIGDYIRMDDEIKGVVRKITPRSVVIRKNNSHTIVLPNTKVINKPIYNWNYVRNFIAFDDIHVPISFKEDPMRVKELLLQAVQGNPNILKNPKPIIRLDEFRDYGYVFLVRGFLSSDLTLEQWDIASDVRLAIMKILRENAIEIASPIEIIKILAKNGQKKDLVE